MAAMFGMFGSRLRLLLASSLGACTLGCEIPRETAEAPDNGTANSSGIGSADSPEISQACFDRIAQDALNNPRTNSMAANFAGPLGLAPSSEPDAAPYLSKQVEFRTPDGAIHYFAIGSPESTKAVLMRLVPTEAEPTVSLFVLARDGGLLAAGRIENRRLSVLSVSDAAVRSAARAEQRLWAAAGPVGPCRHRQ
jgi:hypothetical protein